MTSEAKLVHRSRAEMYLFLQKHLQRFPTDMVELVLDFMMNVRLLLIVHPSGSGDHFRAVWYNLFSETDNNFLQLLSDTVHASRVVPSGTVKPRRRVNRTSEVRNKKRKRPERNFQKLVGVDLNRRSTLARGDKMSSEPQVALLAFANGKTSRRSMCDLEKEIPFDKEEKAEIDVAA